jgi:hypothetical protein
MTKLFFALFLLGAAGFAQVDASQITKGTLPPARLPAPTAATLGGVKGTGTALACPVGETQNSFNSDGSPCCIVVNGLAPGTLGQVCVFNPSGTGSWPQTKRAPDKGDTTLADQAANITSAWNAMGSQNQMQFLKGSMSVGSSITPNSLAAYRIEGIGGIGQSGSGTILKQTGATAYPVLNLDRQRDSILGNFSLNMNGVAGSIGMLISQLSGTNGQISSHNVYHDINISDINGAGTVGIQLAAAAGVDSFSNNEAHVFWRNALAGSTGGTGFLATPGTSNARSIALYEHEMSGTDTAYEMGAGSWHVLGGLTEGHKVALLVKVSNGGFYGFVHDEGSKQGIVFDPFANGSNGTHIFMGNRYEVDNPDLMKYQWDFSFANELALTIGNYFNTNANITKMVQPRTNLGRWLSIGDRLPNTTIANLPDMRVMNAATNIATANIFGADIASVVRTSRNPAGDGDGLNGLWIGATAAGGASSWQNSSGLVVSAIYTDGSSNNHLVPIRFKTLLSDASGTSPAIFKMLPPTDPVTSTTYAGPIDIDFQTNGHNFTTKNQISTTYSTATNCAVNSVSPAACGSAASGAVVIPTTTTTYTVNTTAVTAHSRIFLTWLSFASDLPRAPKCVPPAATTQPTISNIASGASFTIALGSTTGQTCVQYEIKN